MNIGPTPLVNKLILLVLSGILACLVLLVVRPLKTAPAPQNPTSTRVVEAPEATPPDEILPPSAVLSKADASRSTRLLPTNAPRSANQARPAEFPLVAAPPISDGSDRTSPAVAPILPVVASVPVGGTIARPPISIDAPVFGVVTLAGTPPPEVPVDFGPSCGRLQTNTVTTRHYVVGPEGQLANVLVYLKDRMKPNFEALGPAPVIDQVGCLFQPYVTAVMAGQPFQIRNSDSEFHNIHATPRLNHELNLAQHRDRTDTKKFDRPELFVRLKCDVHPWMFAYVNVVGHPFYSVTDTNGFFALPAGLPPGRYAVSAIHLRAGEQTQEIEIGAGERKLVNFRLQVDGGRMTANPQGSSSQPTRFTRN
jgi:hypothetical protein